MSKCHFERAPFLLLGLLLLVSCGNKKAYEARLKEAEKKLEGIMADSNAIQSELTPLVDEFNDNVRLVLEACAAIPSIKESGGHGNLDLNQATDALKRENQRLTMQEAVLQKEIQSLKEEVESYRTKYLKVR